LTHMILSTKIGRLRLLGFLEGISLLVLSGVAVPLKYGASDPSLVRALGPVHGLLFLLYVLGALGVGIEYRWKFTETTWQVLLACMVPFGTFYIDRKILSRLPARAPAEK
jgi:integral membrane protein